MLNNLKTNYFGVVAVAIVMAISLVSHGFNMFRFPYYENDEGTYMSQAWSVLEQGSLAPYTYWYDHAPAGWLFLATWVKLTGGFFTFGTSVNSGRAFMLVLHLFTSGLLIYVAKKLSGSIIPGLMAVLIFSLSPLGIYFQRRVLLDNIMVFWIFVSLAILLKDKLRLSQIILSGLVFGIAVLTKENAIFSIPAFVYAVYIKSHPGHRSFALIKWLAVAGFVVSTYFLYALLKSEFFPVGVINNLPHVSLISSLLQQAGRGSSSYFWDKNSDFYVNLMEWMNRDRLTIILGVFATIASLILSIKNRALRIPAYLSILFWLFLLRGKLVIDFYIVPLIPFLALNIGMLSYFIFRFIAFRKKFIYVPLVFIFAVAVSAYLLTHPTGQYTRDETISQVQTIDWIKKNVSGDSFIAIDCALYVDLHAPRFEGDTVFPNADWVWKVEYDPEILTGKLGEDWKNIQYITLGHEVLKQIRDHKFYFIKKAFDNSVLAYDSERNTTSHINIDQYLSTNGDWMRVYQVKNKEALILDSSWKFYKSNFVISYGQVIDPQGNNRTTSEGQSLAMLRAVWLNDKYTFDGVWQWTVDHLQKRTQDKLFSWLWEKKGEDYGLADSNTAADADSDIALALLFAYRRWGGGAYLSSARAILNDMWKKEVVLVNGRYYLTAGTDAARNGGYLINPSYSSPASFRIFAKVDPRHPWDKLADDSYYLFNQYTLVPNWILLDRRSGQLSSASAYVNDKDVDNYGYDAFRTMWHVALDSIWFKNSKATDFLAKNKPFFSQQWQENQRFFSVYELDGAPVTGYSSVSTEVGALSVFSQTDAKMAADLFQKNFENNFNYDEGYWGDKSNYYDQNWAWFGSALATNRLINLWK
ncbi:MAG: glycosyl hydrolase family 8 [Candidatus Shapirobacteria bacterium]|jgi:endo-1,4-beta-D-glucanase Y/4-amino-4-deoxy-L-arabinose transferase-like glycosyltransferase